MIEKIHHIGIAVHSLDEPPVILSADHARARKAMLSRRNLGWGRRPRALDHGSVQNRVPGSALGTRHSTHD
jgi:hypothetical protein